MVFIESKLNKDYLGTSKEVSFSFYFNYLKHLRERNGNISNLGVGVVGRRCRMILYKKGSESLHLDSLEGKKVIQYKTGDSNVVVRAILDEDEVTELLEQGITMLRSTDDVEDAEPVISLELAKAELKLIICGKILIKELQLTSKQFEKFESYLKSN